MQVSVMRNAAKNKVSAAGVEQEVVDQTKGAENVGNVILKSALIGLGADVISDATEFGKAALQ
jgi:hypothetical protein